MRHLGARDEARGPRGHLRLRRRHPRHADHAESRGRGHYARGADRPGRRRAPRRLRRVRHRLRQLLHDPFRGKPPAHRADVRGAREGGPHHAAQRAPGVRRESRHVPAGPLRQGNLPALRHAGPVRRQLRELRRHILTFRPGRPALGRLRHASRSSASPSTSSSASGTSRRCCASGRARARCRMRSRTSSTSGSRRGCATGTSRATRPISASRSPTRRASTSTSGSTRRSATWPPLPTTVPGQASTSRRGGSRTATPSCTTSSARTSCTSTRCSGRRRSRARASGSRRPCTRTAS